MPRMRRDDLLITDFWSVIDDPSLSSVRGCATPDGVAEEIEHEKGIRWMPWHQEAMKDVARCEKPRGAASRR